VERQSNDQEVRTTCPNCTSACSILVQLREGKPIIIKGDPEGSLNKGFICPKGAASLELSYHPDRLKHPLKRVGERGNGKFQTISWDEALNIVADKLTQSKKKYGAESVAFIRGAARGWQDTYAGRFANVFGTPNIASQGSVCFRPRYNADIVTTGYFPIPDWEGQPTCIVLWGRNPVENYGWEQNRIHEIIKKDTKLVIIDVRKTKLGKVEPDLRIQPRPGSDLALALGMINVIIDEGLYDKDFVDNWTIGFDELKAHVQKYPPEKVENITWVSAETIRRVARLYATSKPAILLIGNACEQGINGFQTCRAAAILQAITGNLGIPGGEMNWKRAESMSSSSPEFSKTARLPASMRGKKVDANYGLCRLFGGVVPQSIIKALVTKEPYPIRVLYCHATNLLLVDPNAQEVYLALKEKLDFLVVADLFMTPTAALADIVLPVSSYLEFDCIHHLAPQYQVCQVMQKVTEVGECWSDWKIFNELAKRIEGMEDYCWPNEEEFLNALVKPAGLTFEEFRKVEAVFGVKKYRFYEKDGFATPSKKVELYSNQLKEWGFDPLPRFYEPPETPYSDPDLAKKYPLILTSRKLHNYQHSTGRQIGSLRFLHPEPITEINTKTASELGIKDGDWVYIETKRGRIRQKASLTDAIDPRVVMVDYGWWFPEKGASEQYGWAESNINILTDNNPPYDVQGGSTRLRFFLCKVSKES
jgi:anaerobic selenocysteine-containing dehydrogenase